MRKYRYGNPNQQGIFRKYGNFIYFFVAWNFFGVVIWKALGAQKKAHDKDWDEKSTTDKYLALTGIGERAKRVKIGQGQNAMTVDTTKAQDTAQQ